MPHDGGRRRPEQTCRCPSCGQEFVLDEGQKCTSDECPYCSPLIGDILPPRPGFPRRREVEISQTKGGTRGPGRRDEEEGKFPPEQPPWLPPPEDVWIPKPPPWEPKPPLFERECRCPSCDYRIFLHEEGARCLLTDCPQCGYRMVNV